MLAVFFPSALAAVWAVHSTCAPQAKQRQAAAVAFMWAAILTLLQPAAVLIDHGHFQYNNIALGLTVCAASSASECKGHLLMQ